MAVQLQHVGADIAGTLRRLGGIKIVGDDDGVDAPGNGGDHGPSLVDRDSARALLAEHDANGIGSGFERHLGLVRVTQAADLHVRCHGSTLDLPHTRRA
ncbi:hypothetical protein GCM10009860_13080 [Microbacterium mitrae]